MNAADVMTPQVITVTPDTTVSAIVKLMVEKKIGAVPVVDAHGHLAGIVTEADLLRRKELGNEKRRTGLAQFLASSATLEEEYIRAHATTAAELMQTEIVTAAPATPLTEIVDLFEKHRIHRLPIVEDGHVVGILSQTDLVRALAAIPPAPPPEQLSDGQIRKRLLAELSHLPWSDIHGNNIVVKQGVVHFWGLVDSPTQFDALKVAAETVPGVTGVVDHTVVASQILPLGV